MGAFILFSLAAFPSLDPHSKHTQPEMLCRIVGLRAISLKRVETQQTATEQHKLVIVRWAVKSELQAVE